MTRDVSDDNIILLIILHKYSGVEGAICTMFEPRHSFCLTHNTSTRKFLSSHSSVSEDPFSSCNVTLRLGVTGLQCSGQFTFRLTNVIPERIIFVSRRITVYSSTCFEYYCAHHQEIKIVLYRIWYTHTETRDGSKITKIQFYKYNNNNIYELQLGCSPMAHSSKIYV